MYRQNPSRRRIKRDRGDGFLMNVNKNPLNNCLVSE